jgi:predicted AlkP superfamily phosphohydrolase/phosphomutase
MSSDDRVPEMIEKKTGSGRRVLLIGFDSATPAIVEEGIAAGWLPNLARLRERGAYGRLRSTSDWLVSSHWASFCLGVPPNEHGCYHFLQWHPDEMSLKRNDPAWMIREPFWRELAAHGTRVVALDVPYTHGPRTRSAAVELSGWATNELVFEPYAHPGWLESLAKETYGRSLRLAGRGLAFERYAPRPLGDLLRIRDQLVEITEQSSRLARSVMEREPWDVLFAVFGSVHRGGHLLWSGSSVEGDAGPDVDRTLQAALRDVYVAVDAAVGRVVEAAGDDATVMVFSLIGMSDNTSRTDLLPGMLARILAGDTNAAPDHEKIGLAKRMRQAIPLRWRHAIKAGLPLSLQDRLSMFWRTGRVDWSRTRAFSLTADVHGYIRINLRGRESRGVVEPGTEYDRLCAEITDGLLSFVDTATGDPVVAEVRRRDDLFGSGARRDALPDLIVRWAPTPCARTAGVTSPRFGTIPWPTPGKNPNGRSGNHTPEGFVIAAGDGIGEGSTLSGHEHILDLPPTILSLLGRAPFPYMSGDVIPAIATLRSPERRPG